MSASLCSVAPKIWLALPTSAVPFMIAARVGEGAGDADADRGRAAEQRIVVVARECVALHQHLALEGVVLHRVAAGVKQIGVAAEDLAVAEHNHAAALADAPVQQADVDRIQPVLHDVPVPAAVAQRQPVSIYAKARPPASTRQVARKFPHGKRIDERTIRREQ